VLARKSSQGVDVAALDGLEHFGAGSSHSLRPSAWIRRPLDRPDVQAKRSADQRFP
jgi:hypothetical protein